VALVAVLTVTLTLALVGVLYGPLEAALLAMLVCPPVALPAKSLELQDGVREKVRLNIKSVVGWKAVLVFADVPEILSKTVVPGGKS
jgi:hypothetical protein